ncbi:MAG TPA: hypothetical protein DEQ47_15635, partial [Solibacterales bacterium]|nr:hypothetical protein [Bryobacterales bacterium]
FIFVVKHAHEAKVLLESLAAIKIISIFAPFIAEASSSGALVAGLTMATMKMTGLGSVAKGLGPLFARLGTWIMSLRAGLYGLGFSEGVALIATKLLAGALAVLTSPITIVVGGLALLAAGMYYFRDSTFHAKGEVYKLRDAYLALWEVLTFQNKNGEKTFTSVLARIKKEREDSEKKAPGAKPYSSPRPPTPDTGGLAGGTSDKDKKDVYGEEIKRLDLAAIAAVKYLSVIDAAPDKIQAVTAAMHAQSEILRINNELHQQGKAALTDAQRATLTEKFTLEETLKALDDYGKSLVSEQHSSELATIQADNMAAAVLNGEDAVRKA